VHGRGASYTAVIARSSLDDHPTRLPHSVMAKVGRALLCVLGAAPDAGSQVPRSFRLLEELEKVGALGLVYRDVLELRGARRARRALAMARAASDWPTATTCSCPSGTAPSLVHLMCVSAQLVWPTLALALALLALPRPRERSGPCHTTWLRTTRSCSFRSPADRPRKPYLLPLDHLRRPVPGQSARDQVSDAHQPALRQRQQRNGARPGRHPSRVF
jgi:hypothetical protein